MMRACLGYFVAYVGEPDENGRYHIVPSVCHEQERSKANHRENSAASVDLPVVVNAGHGLSREVRQSLFLVRLGRQVAAGSDHGPKKPSMGRISNC